MSPQISTYDHLAQYQFEPAKGILLTCDPECPTPEDGPANYDIPALERRKAYVTRLKQRDITPRTTQFARQYSQAVEMALERLADEKPTESDRETWRSLVHQYDILMQYNQEMFHIPSEALLSLRKHLQDALAAGLYARYRDYVAIFLSQFKDIAKEHHKIHAPALTGYWQNINNAIELENQTMMGPHPVSAAVRAVCHTMGIAEDRAFWMIKAYAMSNNFFHANIEDNLAAGYVGSVAKVLYYDLKEVDHVFPGTGIEESDAVKETLKTVIENITKQLFTWDEQFKDVPEGWDLTEQGRQIKTRKEQTRQINKGLTKKIETEIRTLERRRRMADDAMKDIRHGKRKFAELSLNEIDALQKNEPKFREAIALAESSRNLKKKAGKKRKEAIEVLRSALDVELETIKDDSDEDDDLEDDAPADKEKQAAAFNELLHDVFGKYLQKKSSDS
ncbi:hypothetical protein LTS15_001525 [Exophiala xenobiotica]|nr:hypothetical protein LTS15_001525 [Exophiala xenobiotica]